MGVAFRRVNPTGNGNRFRQAEYALADSKGIVDQGELRDHRVVKSDEEGVKKIA